MCMFQMICTQKVHQKANCYVDISEDFAVESFSDAKWVFSTTDESLAATQNSCCGDIDIWLQGVLL